MYVFTWQWKTYSGVVFLNLEFQMRVTPSGSLGESSLALYDATNNSGCWKYYKVVIIRQSNQCFNH